MTNFHKFSGDPKCIPTSQRSFIGHLNDKFFVAKPSYSFDSGFIHSFTETRRHGERTKALRSGDLEDRVTGSSGHRVVGTHKIVPLQNGSTEEIVWREDENVYSPIARPLPDFLSSI